MLRPAFVGVSLLLAACAMSGPVAAPELPAPMLVVDVTNASADEAVLGWEFDGEGTSGGGESLVAPCRRDAMPLSSISGDYSITVDGESVFEGAVPQRAGSETFLVVGLRIGPDGEVEVTAPGVALQPPRVSTALPGCGES
jgi:hypothetical protein